MSVILVTLQQAKDQIQASGYDDEDSAILLKAEEATDIVVGYIKRPNHGWTDRTVPGRIRAAILLVLGNLYGNKGDGPGADPLGKAVCDLLARDRDPALA